MGEQSKDVRVRDGKEIKAILSAMRSDCQAQADNRPLTLEEFEARLGQIIYISATPGTYELEKVVGHVVEQIVRPTFMVDPIVEVVSMLNHTEHLLQQIRERIAAGERTLVTTCTKRHAEELAASIRQAGIACGWLHQDLKGSARVGQLRRLRQGHLKVLVGVDLLREGIDLPEVSLVAILDADKGGFLHSARWLDPDHWSHRPARQRQGDPLCRQHD